jgi:hypothetical protein
MRIAPRNVVLAGVLALLVALQFMGGPQEMPGRETERLLPQLVPSEAVRIEVVAGERRVALARVAGEWCLPDLGNFPAERQLVERVLQVLAELTTLDLLTEDPTRHVEYGLDEATAQRLRVTAGGEVLVADLLIGRAPSGSAFVRRAGEDAVYGASILPRTSSDVQGWQRTVALVPLEPTTVLRLELSGAELGASDPLVLRRDENRYDRWLDAAGQEVPSAKAERLVDVLMKLYVDRVLATEVGEDGGTALGLSTPRFTVRVTAAQNQGVERQVEAKIGGTARDGIVPALSSTGPWVLGLREASVERILLHVAPLRR